MLMATSMDIITTTERIDHHGLMGTMDTARLAATASASALESSCAITMSVRGPGGASPLAFNSMIVEPEPFAALVSAIGSSPSTATNRSLTALDFAISPRRSNTILTDPLPPAVSVISSGSNRIPRVDGSTTASQPSGGALADDRQSLAIGKRDHGAGVASREPEWELVEGHDFTCGDEQNTGFLPSGDRQGGHADPFGRLAGQNRDRAVVVSPFEGHEHRDAPASRNGPRSELGARVDGPAGHGFDLQAIDEPLAAPAVVVADGNEQALRVDRADELGVATAVVVVFLLGLARLIERREDRVGRRAEPGRDGRDSIKALGAGRRDEPEDVEVALASQSGFPDAWDGQDLGVAFVVVGLDLADLERLAFSGVRGQFEPIGAGFLVLDILISVLAVGILDLHEVAAGLAGLDGQGGVLADRVVGLAKLAAVGTKEGEQWVEPRTGPRGDHLGRKGFTGLHLDSIDINIIAWLDFRLDRVADLSLLRIAKPSIRLDFRNGLQAFAQPDAPQVRDSSRTGETKPQRPRHGLTRDGHLRFHLCHRGFEMVDANVFIIKRECFHAIKFGAFDLQGKRLARRGAEGS